VAISARPITSAAIQQAAVVGAISSMWLLPTRQVSDGGKKVRSSCTCDRKSAVGDCPSAVAQVSPASQGSPLAISTQ
jgi:hypothetical protein